MDKLWMRKLSSIINKTTSRRMIDKLVNVLNSVPGTDLLAPEGYYSYSLPFWLSLVAWRIYSQWRVEIFNQNSPIGWVQEKMGVFVLYFNLMLLFIRLIPSFIVWKDMNWSKTRIVKACAKKVQILFDPIIFMYCILFFSSNNKRL